MVVDMIIHQAICHGGTGRQLNMWLQQIIYFILYFLYSPIDLYASLEIKKKIRNLCPRECSIRQYSTMCLPCDFFVYYCYIVITHQ